MFFSNDVLMDFAVVPKQPFYVLDVSFSASWLLQQFNDADTSFKKILDKYIYTQPQTILIEPCSAEDYKTLQELELLMLADKEDVLFIRSRIYKLILNFFGKIFNRKEAELTGGVVHYEQIMEAEKFMMESMQKPPKIDAIARKVNLSISSLVRQFKLLYGKSVYGYYLERKMELAKKILIENKIPVKEIAEMMGYKQVSAFIESFTKHHGYRPGAFKPQY
jgi:AraC-like DNA-binding protein